jgi:predicted acylesterase/phospholipase RssA
MKRALVLSGGGLFGAWQAGAWRALSGRFTPDLVVGVSAGALNGYAIAGGADPDELCALWLDGGLARLDNLPRTIRGLMERYPPCYEYAAAITDLLRLKPVIVSGREVTWKHLAASCAVPGLLPQRRIGGRWYSDGGLLNPLPVWAAVDLGATDIVALNATPEFPRMLLPFVRGFRRVAGHHPTVPADVSLQVLTPSRRLGRLRDGLVWNRANVEHWIAQGFEDAQNISIPNCTAR